MNFPEIWESRVRQTLEVGAEPDFLKGVPELDGDVTEMGEKNLIHVPATHFNPDVLINNSTYPLAVQDYDEETITLSLDKYQSKPTRVTDDQVQGASYNKIDAVTRSHTNSISVRKYSKAIHAIAPVKHTATTPVVAIKGDSCTYSDLVALKKAADKAKWPIEGRRLVLTPKHWNELLEDRGRFAELLINHKTGEVLPMIAGWEITQYVNTPVYKADGNKRAFGEVVESTDKEASVAFVVDNVGKKTGITKQYYSEAKTSPTTQANLLAYRHYFIATPVESKYIAALIDK